jgi:hypothetical protein
MEQRLEAAVTYHADAQFLLIEYVHQNVGTH